MKSDHYTRMNPRIRAKNIEILQRIYNDAVRPETVRRSAALRLARLRAATKRPPVTTKRPPVTSKATAPAPKPAPVAPTEDAKFQAYQAFRALCAQRSALIRKRKTKAELEIFHSMVCLMPGTVPNADDQNGWRDFIARVDATLSEIKTITII